VKTSATVRIHKFLADAGYCSRRAAEALVSEGAVSINGDTAQIGAKVTPGNERVLVYGKPIHPTPQPKVTLAVHKPKGLVCTNKDEHNPRTIFDLLPADLGKLRFFCAGRLDKDSEGLVILTTDGDLANQLMHPSSLIVKQYKVWLKTPFPKGKLATLKKGINYEGERLKVEKASLIGPRNATESRTVDLEMHHGKKREIRRLFFALGFDVARLKRYQIGKFSLRGFPLRAVKILHKTEIEQLLKSNL
jgi:23S rRNA pseudouridine2605 synthase